MLLNPRNPHHGVDCICDSCWKYWSQYARSMAKALAGQRATEQAIDDGGEGSNAGNEQSPNPGEKSILPPIIEEGNPSNERDCNTDPSEGAGALPARREFVDGKTTRYRVELWDFMGKDPYYVVSDFQGNIVCQCAEKHNAKLIAWLLEYHS